MLNKFIFPYPRTTARRILLAANYITVCGLGFILGFALSVIPG